MNYKKNYLLLPALCIVSFVLFLPISCQAQNHTLTDQLYQEAETLNKKGQHLAAARMLEKSAAAEKASANPRQAVQALILNQAGLFFYEVEEYPQAIINYKQAVEILTEIGGDKDIAPILNNIGNALASSGDLPDALNYYQLSLEGYKKAGALKDEANEHKKIGDLYFRVSQYQKAIQSYQQSLQIARTLKDEPLTAYYLIDMGLAHKKAGLLDQALKCYNEAIQINKRLGNDRDAAVAFSNIGNIFRITGQYELAIKNFSESINTYQRLGLDGDVAIDLINIGAIYIQTGNYKEAEESLGNALKIHKRIGSDLHIAYTLSALAVVFSEQGLFDKSIQHYQETLAIYRQLGRVEDIGIELSNIGNIYSAWGQYPLALENYLKALVINRQLDNPENLIMNLLNIGNLYYKTGEYKKAINVLNEGMGISIQLGMEGHTAVAQNSLATIYSKQNKYKLAIELYKKALDIHRRFGNKPRLAEIMNNIGMLALQHDDAETAIQFFNDSLVIDRELNNSPGAANTLNNIGVLYHSQNQYGKAVEYFQESIKLLEEIRQTAPVDIRRDYLASQIHTYQLMASSYLVMGDSQGVLDAVEQSRARVLVELVGGINTKLNTPTLTEVQEGLTRDEAVLMFSNIAKDNFILMVITAEDVALKEISKDSFLANSRKLYKNSLVLLLEKQRGMIIPVASQEDKKTFEKKKLQAGFETAIHYYRNLLTHPDNVNDTRKFSRLLHTLLIEPVRKNLSGKTRITIIPDSILGFLPFETLMDGEGNYLVQNYNLRYIQSLTIDKLLKGRVYTDKNKRKPLLAMGGAIYDQQVNNGATIGNSKQLALLQNETDRIMAEKRSSRSTYSRLGIGSWSNLPGTLTEVKELANIIKGGDILTGDKVTENSIKEYSSNGKLADYKILHFATHGLVVQEIPELSAIVLSQFQEEQDGEDGYLRMGEIAGLNLAADFVNLSACETGLGRIYGGEGVVGLTQSFLIAGANGLSVSLWQVADDSTSQFMIELYKKAQTTGLGYNQAMAEVKRKFINGDYGKKYQAPYYWSPFIYYGQ